QHMNLSTALPATGSSICCPSCGALLGTAKALTCPDLSAKKPLVVRRDGTGYARIACSRRHGPDHEISPACLLNARAGVARCKRRLHGRGRHHVTPAPNQRNPLQEKSLEANGRGLP